MTEEEAKNKWCPFTRLDAVANAVNRAQDGELMGACVGSACMAWRDLPERSTAKARELKAADLHVSSIKALREFYPDLSLKEAKEIVVDGTRPWPAEEKRGYCGLAGPVQ